MVGRGQRVRIVAYKIKSGDRSESVWTVVFIPTLLGVLAFLVAFAVAGFLFYGRDVSASPVDGAYAIAPPSVQARAIERMWALEKKVRCEFRTWTWLPGIICGLAVVREGSDFRWGRRENDERDGTMTRWGICGYYTTPDVCVIPFGNLTTKGVQVLLDMPEEIAKDPIDVFSD